MPRICVFCGSSFGRLPVYREAAVEVGRQLGRRGIGLVYGGGNVGLMGAVADAALAAGGQVIGVIPRALVDREIDHRGLTQLRVVDSMHERKALMAELSDAFLALPGGIGTFEELCEALAWSKLGIHGKACGVLNVEGYYDPLLAMMDLAVSERFLAPEDRALLIADTDAARLIERLLA
ncbi:MAG: TIGR00730 family Rossman fold protein [Bryobacteraceae bacterium]